MMIFITVFTVIAGISAILVILTLLTGIIGAVSNACRGKSTETRLDAMCYRLFWIFLLTYSVSLIATSVAATII